MTKQEIIGYVQSMFLREDVTQRYHERVVIAHVEKVLNEMYNELYKINPRLLSGYTKTYGTTTAIQVLQEASTGRYYSALPVQTIAIDSIAGGVLHIYPKATYTGNQFIPMNATQADFVYDTDVAIVTSKIGYRARQDSRVEYWNMTNAVITSGVIMELLVPFSVYADTDVVQIPETGEKFEARVYSSLQAIPPAELRDDNSSTPIQKR